jgi:hypothetical protein
MPPDYGTAKPAVDAYLTFMGRVDDAYRDPAHVSASTFTNYLAGQAKQLFDTNFAQEKAQGKAYRGRSRSPGAGHGEPHGRVFAVGPAAGLRR